MKAATAIRNWLGEGSKKGKPTVAEMKEFKKATDPKEWQQMGRDSAEMLNVEFTEV